MLSVMGCAAQSRNGSESDRPSWVPNLSNLPLVTSKGSKATLISELKPGPYQVSSLAIGEEKDLARQRGEGFGFVRSAPIERYLGEVRSKLLGSSGVTGVPGSVMIQASSEFNAISTADGNVYVTMSCLESLSTADEVAAILAHELSHVLLTHHTSSVVVNMQRKGQALHEIAVSAKTALSASKTVAKSDARGLANEQLALDVTDKLAFPAWNRREEREADLLGVDLLVRAGYARQAMITMLEKLQAWEQQTAASEESFWDRLKQTAQRNPGEAVSVAYAQVVDVVSVRHPKTEERISEVVEYLERHYAELKLTEPQTVPWKTVTDRADVAQVWRNYHSAFSARKLLEKGNNQEAYPAAKAAATGRTATDAYPNWVLYLSAGSLGRQREALDALRRAISSRDPVPQIYEEMISHYEQAGNIDVALNWTDKASVTFGKAPRWTPTKIRLLRKAGRTGDAETLTLSCSVDTPEWKRPCQKANQTPAGRGQR
jgi:beta-barrel assembly-enhancing protease